MTEPAKKLELPLPVPRRGFVSIGIRAARRERGLTLDVGRQIRDARKEAGLEHKQLAELVGVHERTVIRWQDNHTRPTFERLVMLSIALNKPISYFFENGQPSATQEV